MQIKKSILAPIEYCRAVFKIGNRDIQDDTYNRRILQIKKSILASVEYCRAVFKIGNRNIQDNTYNSRTLQIKKSILASVEYCRAVFKTGNRNIQDNTYNRRILQIKKGILAPIEYCRGVFKIGNRNIQDDTYNRRILQIIISILAPIEYCRGVFKIGNRNIQDDTYNRRILQIIISIVFLVHFFPIKVYSSATDTFVDSLHSLRDKADVQVIETDSFPKRKIITPTPQVNIRSLERDRISGTTLGNLSTPMPAFEDYLVRELTPDEYSKFYSAFTEGELASKENNLPNAIRYYTEAISIAPFYYVGYTERGKILAKNDKYSLAIQDFTAAIRVNPKIADPYIFRAVTRTKERQYGLALEDYQSALNLLGNNPILFDKQGEILLILNDFAGARMSYTQAIEAKPTESRYYYQRAIANSGLHNYTGMISDYLRAFNTNNYTERLVQMRSHVIEELEKKYYPKEANPISIIQSPESIFLRTASLPMYNPFQDVRTIPPTSPAYQVINEIKELQNEFPTSTLRIMQVYVARRAYEDALAVLQEYMQKVAKTQYGFTAKTMLVFVGYLNQMLGRYEDANTAYSVFLHTTRKYRFFYCNYVLSMLKKEGFIATKDMILAARDNVRNPKILNQILSYLAMIDNDYINAIRFMEQVVEQDPFIYYKLQMFAIYSLGREYKKAFTIVNSLLTYKESPFLADIYVLYGLAALEDKQYYLAGQNFKKAQELVPIWLAKVYSYITVAEAGKPLAAIDLITEALKNILLSDREKMELNAIKGELEYKMGDYTKSLIAYTIALNTGAEGSKRLNYNIAFLEFKKKNYESALTHINLFLDEYPRDALGYVLRGDIELSRKEIQRALEDYKKSILLDKKLTYPYVHVANAMYALGMFDTAKKYYLTILEKSADDVANYIVLAILNAQANNIEESLEYCKRIIDKDPKVIQAYLIRGMIYQRLGNLQDAYKNYTKVSEIDPQDSFSFTMRGELLEKQKEYRKAISEFTKAIELNTFATEAYIMRGLLYLYLGDKNAGLLDLEASKRLFVFRQDKQSADIIETIIYNITKQVYVP